MSCCIRARGIALRNHVASESPDSTANELAGPLRSYQRRRLRYGIGSSIVASRRAWRNLTDAESVEWSTLHVALTFGTAVGRLTAQKVSPLVRRAGLARRDLASPRLPGQSLPGT